MEQTFRPTGINHFGGTNFSTPKHPCLVNAKENIPKPSCLTGIHFLPESHTLNFLQTGSCNAHIPSRNLPEVDRPVIFEPRSAIPHGMHCTLHTSTPPERFDKNNSTLPISQYRGMSSMRRCMLRSISSYHQRGWNHSSVSEDSKSFMLGVPARTN